MHVLYTVQRIHTANLPELCWRTSSTSSTNIVMADKSSERSPASGRTTVRRGAKRAEYGQENILEILRTVIARYTDGVFQLQNFLIIGVIAAVRHILTVGASMTLASGKSQEQFDREIGRAHV